MKSKEESFLSINKIATAGRGSTALLTCTTNITLLIVDCVVRHLNKPMASVSSLKKKLLLEATHRLISYAYADNHKQTF